MAERQSAVRWLKRVVIGFGVVLVLLLFWGLAVEPRLINTERESAAIPHLPPIWEGQQVAVVADFQIGMWGANTSTIRRIVKGLVERPPAAVLIAGDFVYKADDKLDHVLPMVVELVRPLPEAGIPTFAVLGNHDYSMDVKEDPINPRVAQAVKAALEKAGVRVLQNDAVPLFLRARVQSDPLYIVGIDSEWAGQARPADAVAQVPRDAGRFVFMHNPASFKGLPAGTAPIAVAAHTHGGQIAFPFTPRWSWMRWVKDQVITVDGWASAEQEPPGNHLYVNVGIGFSDVPIRINAPPELTLFTLRGGSVPAQTAPQAQRQ
jgi:predicted MPP superfamily phosphohydrolase